MEVRSTFEVIQQHPRFSSILLSFNTREKLHQSAYVLAVFNFRDTFQPLYRRCKSLEVHRNNDEQRIHHPSFAKIESSKLPDLSFRRLQVTGQDNHSNMKRRDFGQLVAREALTDDEYWSAAWLRAEAHWESVSYMRHLDSYKRKFAEQEFYALKRRCSGEDGNSLKCYCFVAVKKDHKSYLRTVLNSVMGTMDLSIRQFLNGETYPGEVKRVNSVFTSQEPLNGHKYAYIANVCVMKSARQWGIATNMLYLAIDVAASAGMKQVYVHVNTDNIPAQKLYQKVGFKNVEAASAPLAKEQMIIMSMELRQGCKFCSNN